MEQEQSKPTRCTLTGDALRLLLERLDPDPAIASHILDGLRHRLIAILRWEGCELPEELAADVLGRAAGAFTGEGVQSFESAAASLVKPVIAESNPGSRTRGSALRIYQLRENTPLSPLELDCLQRLEEGERRLLLSYFHASRSTRDRARHQLATELRISPAVLRNQAVHLRQRLESCLHGRQSGKTGFKPPVPTTTNQAEPEVAVVARAYFLGRLNESERDRLREQLLASDDVLSLFVAAEIDIADDYVRGEMTPADQLAFERWFPVPEKLRCARMIQSEGRKPAWKRFVPAAAIVLAFATGALALLIHPRQVQPPTLEQRSVSFAFSLPAGRVTGAGYDVVVPKAATLLEIHLRLEPPVGHVSYTVIVQNSGGQAVFSARNLLARRPPVEPSVDAHIPASILAPGEYKATLYGLRIDGTDELLERYAFRIR